jgi:hypothetical protein
MMDPARFNDVAEGRSVSVEQAVSLSREPDQVDGHTHH